MKFGAHISTAKPFSEAIHRASEIGCECMQIFVNPPQRWNPTVIPEDEIEKFNEFNKSAKINPIIIHGIYLINLASSNPFYYKQSITSLIDDMTKAAKINALGVNFHVGSTKGAEMKDVMKKVEDGVRAIINASPTEPLLILENAAGAGNIIGDTIEEIAEIIDATKSDRIKVLIDTAHAYESGYQLKNAEGLENFVTKFDQKIGLDKLVGFHFNDSKTDLDSKRDRHADLGTGLLGLNVFKNIIHHPKLKDKFGILETPQDELPWKEQLKVLRGL
jgi:deoxyribonuclease IV